MDTQNLELRQELNRQTGKLLWKELERHFARGIVIKIDGSLDLVEVALQFKKDNKGRIESWIAQDMISHATENDAKDWLQRDPLFWSIVMAPWILVQEISANAVQHHAPPRALH